jgi:hypothetical protein
VIEIEFEKPQAVACECCGEQSTRLTRFVYLDGDAYAVYYASFQEGHPERLVRIAVSMGQWEEGAEPSDRVTFALALRATNARYEVSVTDSAESPWRSAALLGRFLDREEALAHPWLKDVFHITDHVVVQDEPVKRYLDQGAA